MGETFIRSSNPALTASARTVFGSVRCSFHGVANHPLRRSTSPRVTFPTLPSSSARQTRSRALALMMGRQIGWSFSPASRCVRLSTVHARLCCNGAALPRTSTQTGRMALGLSMHGTESRIRVLLVILRTTSRVLHFAIGEDGVSNETCAGRARSRSDYSSGILTG